VVMNSSVFWETTPCSPLRVNRNFGGTCRLHLQVRRISQSIILASCLVYSSSLKTCSSKISVDLQRNTRRCIPEHRTYSVRFLIILLARS
jgi:hypothetical protein